MTQRCCRLYISLSNTRKRTQVSVSLELGDMRTSAGATCITNSKITLNFRDKIGQEERPLWQNIKLLPEWSETSHVAKAYNKVFKEEDTQAEKCTHLRKAATNKAGMEGLDASTIASMTKHRGKWLTALDEVYQTELHLEILAVV